MKRCVTIVGNPKLNSRTLVVAEAIADRIFDEFEDAGAARTSLDLAEFGSSLLDWESDLVEAAVKTVQEADVVVIASPTYKASYTGLLKLFLDRFQAGSLAGIIAVPTMVAAAPHHAMAVDVHLRPLLVELGATCVTPSVFILESQLGDLENAVQSWWERARPSLSLVLGIK